MRCDGLPCRDAIDQGGTGGQLALVVKSRSLLCPLRWAVWRIMRWPSALEGLGVVVIAAVHVLDYIFMGLYSIVCADGWAASAYLNLPLAFYQR
jgi:hypothetical protein